VPTFYLTRRINDRQGRMLAIVVVALPNSFFEEFFSAVTKDKPFSILLAREDESPSSPHPWCTTPRCGATSSRWLTCTCRARHQRQATLLLHAGALAGYPPAGAQCADVPGDRGHRQGLFHRMAGSMYP
jgi:hypothetical protein